MPPFNMFGKISKFYSVWLAFLLVILVGACASNKNVFQKEIEAFRKSKYLEFMHYENSPFKSKEEVAALKYFDPNPKWKLQCTYTKVDGKHLMDIKTYSGSSKSFMKYAFLKCPYESDTLRLELFKSMKFNSFSLQEDLMFLPFKDLTNGESTYGGGRYIDLNENDVVDQTLIVDFNKCYNPYCAYKSEGYSCPIPPVANHLNIEVHAGEKLYHIAAH